MRLDKPQSWNTYPIHHCLDECTALQQTTLLIFCPKLPRHEGCCSIVSTYLGIPPVPDITEALVFLSKPPSHATACRLNHDLSVRSVHLAQPSRSSFLKARKIQARKIWM